MPRGARCRVDYAGETSGNETLTGTTDFVLFDRRFPGRNRGMSAPTPVCVGPLNGTPNHRAQQTPTQSEVCSDSADQLYHSLDKSKAKQERAESC